MFTTTGQIIPEGMDLATKRGSRLTRIHQRDEYKIFKLTVEEIVEIYYLLQTIAITVNDRSRKI